MYKVRYLLRNIFDWMNEKPRAHLNRKITRSGKFLFWETKYRLYLFFFATKKILFVRKTYIAKRNCIDINGRRAIFYFREGNILIEINTRL